MWEDEGENKHMHVISPTTIEDSRMDKMAGNFYICFLMEPTQPSHR